MNNMAEQDGQNNIVKLFPDITLSKATVCNAYVLSVMENKRNVSWKLQKIMTTFCVRNE